MPVGWREIRSPGGNVFKPRDFDPPPRKTNVTGTLTISNVLLATRGRLVTARINGEPDHRRVPGQADREGQTEIRGREGNGDRWRPRKASSWSFARNPISGPWRAMKELLDYVADSARAVAQGERARAAEGLNSRIPSWPRSSRICKRTIGPFAYRPLITAKPTAQVGTTPSDAAAKTCREARRCSRGQACGHHRGCGFSDGFAGM